MQIIKCKKKEVGIAEKLKKFMKIQRKAEIFISLLLIGGAPQSNPGSTSAGELLCSSPALNMNSCDNFCFLLVKKFFG